MSIAIGIAAATVAWFVAAAILFFNPIVDGIYRTEEEHPAVRTLPQTPKTIGMIFGAVLIQCVLWAGVYAAIFSDVPDDPMTRAGLFTAVIVLVKIVPRDLDRILLTTYPPKRLTIEFVVGIVCAAVVAACFAWTI